MPQISLTPQQVTVMEDFETKLSNSNLSKDHKSQLAPLFKKLFTEIKTKEIRHQIILEFFNRQEVQLMAIRNAAAYLASYSSAIEEQFRKFFQTHKTQFFHHDTLLKEYPSLIARLKHSEIDPKLQTDHFKTLYDIYYGLFKELEKSVKETEEEHVSLNKKSESVFHEFEQLVPKIRILNEEIEKSLEDYLHQSQNLRSETTRILQAHEQYVTYGQLLLNSTFLFFLSLHPLLPDYHL